MEELLLPIGKFGYIYGEYVMGQVLNLFKIYSEIEKLIV